MADTSTSILKDFASLMWPLGIGVMIYYYKDQIRDILQVIKERNFTLKVGSMELTFSDATKQLDKELSDLRNDYNLFKSLILKNINLEIEDKFSSSKPIPPVHNILWVDDNPENNAYLINDLKRFDINIECRTSTQSALDEFFKSINYDIIITDMHRAENTPFDETIGIDLIRKVRLRGSSVPIFINCSRWSVEHHGQEAMGAGADLVTNSPTKLMARILSSRFHN